MQNPPRVSVVMPVYNGEAYLSEAVESILAQTYRDFEFVIINDGATDASPAILDRYARSDERIRLDHQPNRGVVEALNRGCLFARGTYLARMDADDIAFPDRLEHQVAFLQQNHRVAVLGGAVEIINHSGKELRTIHYPVEDARIKDVMLDTCPLAHPTVVMRREAFEASGGYRKAFPHAEDYDLWLRMAEHYEFANLPKSVLRYRIHQEQVGTRHLKQQVISSLGAQAAARIRRATGRDPDWQVGNVTLEALRGLGVSDDDVQRATAAACFRWGNLMVLADYEETGNRLWSEGLSCSWSRFPDLALHQLLYAPQGSIRSEADFGRLLVLLPNGIIGTRAFKRRAWGQYHGSRCFEGFDVGRPDVVRRHVSKALYFDPSWLGNRGFLRVALWGFIRGLTRPALRL